MEFRRVCSQKPVNGFPSSRPLKGILGESCGGGARVSSNPPHCSLLPRVGDKLGTKNERCWRMEEEGREIRITAMKESNCWSLKYEEGQDELCHEWKIKDFH